MSSRPARWLLSLSFFACAACEHEMTNQSRFKPLEAHSFFENGQLARPLLEGTVPRGYLDLETDSLLREGKIDGKAADVFPFPITKEVLERGRERFDIFCSVCHDRAGYGKGMIVQRGFPPPPSLHIDRLREMPAGYFVDVTKNGFGQMAGYAHQINAKDRWAIAAYLRALQLSQNASLKEVTDPQAIEFLEKSR